MAPGLQRSSRPTPPPGDIVAIYFDKCPEAYFAILGVLKSGCSFVALDPGAPPSRKQFIIQDSGAMLLLTDKTQPEVLDFAVEVPVVIVTEGSLAQITNPVQDKVSPTISPSDTCYCLYTSGTTGTPKGCEITHENAVQAMLAFQKLFLGHWDEESRWLQFASLHFDVSVLEQYWTWSVGITLVAAPRELILEDVAGTISTLGITHIDPDTKPRTAAASGRGPEPLQRRLHHWWRAAEARDSGRLGPDESDTQLLRAH